jgi:hypothetical protein
MRTACPRRVGAVLAVSLLSMASLGGCRSRLRGVVTVAGEPVGGAVSAPGVAPATQAPASSEEADPRRGRILDELGVPPPATVYFLRWEGDRAMEGPVVDAVRTVITDAKGEFAVDRTMPASGELRIDVAGLAPRFIWVGVQLPILLLGTRTLQGVVHDPEGRVVAGALVRVYVQPEKGRHGIDGAGQGIHVRTRSDGSFRFDRLPGGRCRLTVEGETPEGEGWREEQDWSFAEREPVARVDLGSPKRQPRATVHVHAAPGGELRKVTVLILRSDSGRRRVAKENADGTYTVRLPPGSYEAVMSVGVEGDDEVIREGEAPLHDADGRPATFRIPGIGPDPTIDLYLPPNVSARGIWRPARRDSRRRRGRPRVRPGIGV